MATEQYYFLNTKVSGINHLDVQTSTYANTDHTTTGWNGQTNRTAQAGEYCGLYALVIRDGLAFNTTAVPTTIDTTNGNGFRLTGSKTGTYAAGNWSFSFRVKEASGTTTDCGVSFLLWKSANADGSGGSAIGSRQETSFATNIGTGATVTKTYDPGAITLSGEYLFLLIAIRLDPGGTTPGTQDFFFRGGGATHSVTTTNFTATAAASTTSSSLRNAVLRRRRSSSGRTRG